jgi:23S rRNA pseudouridine1911/1915/1917 synthase
MRHNTGGIVLDIKIIYEDNHLLVVEKPVNLLSQQDETGDPDILSILKNDIKIRYNKPGNVYLGLVHRLDRPVGGVMIFARTSKAASRLSEQVRKREFKKDYIAVIKGSRKRKSMESTPHAQIREMLM